LYATAAKLPAPRLSDRASIPSASLLHPIHHGHWCWPVVHDVNVSYHCQWWNCATKWSLECIGFAFQDCKSFSVSWSLKLLCHSSKCHFYLDSELWQIEIVGDLERISTNLISFEWFEYFAGQWVSIITCKIAVIW
jgi:hypothetical protein